MLVLTRKTREGILVGDSIVVRVHSIRGKNVRFSIEAPKDVRILREELVQKREAA